MESGNYYTKSSRMGSIASHATWWLFFMTYELSIFYWATGHLDPLLKITFFYSLNITLFYAHKKLLDLNFATGKKQIWKFTGQVMLLATLYLGVKLAVDYYLADFVHSKKSVLQNLEELGALDLFRCIYFIGLASLYWTALNISRLRQKAAEDKIRQLVTENNLGRMQNAYLQQQINPHLLFNALNFIHSTLLKVSEEAANHVILLADLMRFSMTEPGADGMILLEDEVEQLRKLLTINQVRFGRPDTVDFHVSGDTARWRIIPLVLMTLAENVFKHGDLAKPGAAISLRVEKNGGLEFRTRNSIRPRPPFPKLKSTGLENIRIRLDYTYGKDYSLLFVENDHIFETELRIP